MASNLPTLRARVEAAQALAAKATPGPWIVHPPHTTSGWGTCVGPAGEMIARMTGGRGSTMKQRAADAVALAAAPDLVTLAADLLALAEAQAAALANAREEQDKAVGRIQQVVYDACDTAVREYLGADAPNIDGAGSDEGADEFTEAEVNQALTALGEALLEARAELTAIRAALGNGADEAAWRPGETVAEAVERLRGERAAIVAYLRALPESHRVGGQLVGTGYSPAAVRALTDAADAIERGDFWPGADALAGEVKP